MTAEGEASKRRSPRRPGEGRDPLRRVGLRDRWHSGRRLASPRRRWLWVPACAGTTWGEIVRPSSPSLPRRDDLDLVAGLQRRLRPAAFRQHVVIQRDREMGALIFEFGEQRVDAGRGNLARLAIDVTRIASPRCRAGRARHRRASVPPAPARPGSRGDKARSPDRPPLSIVIRGRLSGKAGLRPEPNSTMRASANAGCTA